MAPVQDTTAQPPASECFIPDLGKLDFGQIDISELLNYQDTVGQDSYLVPNSPEFAPPRQQSASPVPCQSLLPALPVFGVVPKMEEETKVDPRGHEAPLPQFNVYSLTGDELREELRLRNLPCSGTKLVLIQRLLDSMTTPTGVTHRLSNPVARKRKRPQTRKEPIREDFDTEDAFKKAWMKWRTTRDNNNKSVKRSRENSKIRSVHDRMRNGSNMSEYVRVLENDVALLVRALKDPTSMSRSDKDTLAKVLSIRG